MDLFPSFTLSTHAESTEKIVIAKKRVAPFGQVFHPKSKEIQFWLHRKNYRLTVALLLQTGSTESHKSNAFAVDEYEPTSKRRHRNKK